VSKRLKIIYSESSRRELSIDICMGPIGGGGSGEGSEFFGPPSKKLLGHSYKVFNIQRKPQLKPSRLAPFLSKLGKKGGSVHMSKRQRHTCLGAGRGVSQANEAAIHPKLTGLCQHEIVSGILKKWRQCGTVQASYGCLVGHVCMGVRISVCPITLQHFSFRS
jgi:hypothetical protein